MTDVTAKLDFRKAAFGFIDTNGNFYNADNLGEVTTFYALAEGDTEWQEMSTGTDGCFGMDQNSPMAGFKGWLAFPLENIITEDTEQAAPADAVIKTFYIYHNIKDRTMLNQPFYIDDIELVVDYRFN